MVFVRKIFRRRLRKEKRKGRERSSRGHAKTYDDIKTWILLVHRATDLRQSREIGEYHDRGIEEIDRLHDRIRVPWWLHVGRLEDQNVRIERFLERRSAHVQMWVWFRDDEVNARVRLRIRFCCDIYDCLIATFDSNIYHCRRKFKNQTMAFSTERNDLIVIIFLWLHWIIIFLRESRKWFSLKLNCAEKKLMY